jgi:hypothetical protein
MLLVTSEDFLLNIAEIGKNLGFFKTNPFCLSSAGVMGLYMWINAPIISFFWLKIGTSEIYIKTQQTHFTLIHNIFHHPLLKKLFQKPIYFVSKVVLSL